MYFLYFIAIVVLFAMVINLKKRVRTLELNANKNISSTSTQNVSQSETVKPEQTLAVPTPLSTEQLSTPSGVDDVKEEEDDLDLFNFVQLFHWLKEDWLLKLGSLLLLIGFGWLVTYAFVNNWIGPMGRITLGIIAGTGILILGSWRIRTRIHQGAIFTALGSTIILLTVFAAREMYDIFTPLTALIIMFLSTVFVAFVSVKYRTISLAIIALILAAIAPSLVASSAPSYVSLFSYLSVIILGVIWVVALTGWRILTLLALILAFIYSAPVLADGGITLKSTILLFAYGFGSLFFIFNTIGLLRIKDKSTRADIFTAAGNGMFLLAWIFLAAPKEWQSLLIVAWMLVFTVGAFIIFRYTRRKFAFYIYAGVSVAMLAAATAAQLDGSALLIAYIVESVIISLITYSALKDYTVGQKFSLLMIGPMLLAFESIDRLDRSLTVFNEHFFAILVLALGLLILGFAYRYFTHLENRTSIFAKFYIVQIIVGSLYLYVLLWYSLRNGLNSRSIAIMIAMVIYTIIGLITHIYGKFTKNKALYYYGGIMLALVVLRLFMVDVWRMDMTRRIITFFLIGTLLISTAFINKRKALNNNLEN